MATDGRFVVTWHSLDQDGSEHGIYAQRYQTSGAPDGDEFLVNTHTTADQQIPSVAMSAEGRFVIVWHSEDQDGDGLGVFGQRYDSDGSLLGSEFGVNTNTISDQWLCDVAVAPTEEFVVVWGSLNQDGNEEGVFSQRYSNDGSTADTEFQVNTLTDDHQWYPSVAVAQNGSFIVVWMSRMQDGSGYGIFGQLYSATGAPVGSEFQINSHTTSNQMYPDVAFKQDAGFVVAWDSAEQDGSGRGIYAQRFDASGTALREEFRVNTCISDDQVWPSVAMSSDGSFVVAWHSNGQDGDGGGIFAQRFDETGSPIGTEFRINMYTTSNQRRPSAAMSPDGRFVVVWYSLGQDGDSNGVYGQRFNADGQPLGVLPW